MADQIPHNPDFETKMRAYIALSLLGAIVLMIGYTLYMYGHILAVLTLILGWLTGTANVLLSPYFGSPTATKKADAPIIQQTGDSPVATATTDTPTS